MCDHRRVQRNPGVAELARPWEEEALGTLVRALAFSEVCEESWGSGDGGGGEEAGRVERVGAAGGAHGACAVGSPGWVCQARSSGDLSLQEASVLSAGDLA